MNPYLRQLGVIILRLQVLSSSKHQSQLALRLSQVPLTKFMKNIKHNIQTDF